MPTLEERLWNKIEPEPNSGCWIFIGARLRGNSYGILARGGGHTRGNITAHRAAYEIYRGEIPEGLEPDHRCRLRPCANPWHLELVTRRINFLRGHHPNALTSASNICRRGHPLTAANTKFHGNRRQCRECYNAAMRKRARTVKP